MTGIETYAQSARDYSRLSVGIGTKVFAVVCCALALSMAAWAILAPKSSPGKPAPPPAVGYGYWHGSGPVIEDSFNRPVRIAGVTWYGAETTSWVPGGLDFQPYTKIENLVKRLGYNTIRLTFSDELVQRDPVVRRWVRANPQFRGMRALRVMDAIIAYAGKIGLKIILDNQRSAAAGPKKVSDLDEPLWYTKGYPRSAWIDDWKELAWRYLGNSTVIGFDLRNEPHTLFTGPSHAWNVDDYLFHGATWGPYHGVDNPATDWRLAAEKAGNAVLKINNSLLIFVEGLQLYPANSGCCLSPRANQRGYRFGNIVDSYWWGGILKQVRRYPVILKEPTQLVYSPHEYGPHKVVGPIPGSSYAYFSNMTYRTLSGIFNQQWGFITGATGKKAIAPVFLGETGTCTNLPRCLRLRRPGNQATWFHLMIRYLKLHPNIGWSLWTLNGTNALDSPNFDGLLNRHWNGLQSRYLERVLRRIQTG